jgi:flotillin
MARAYADLAQAFGGPAGLIQFLMIEKGVYTNLAKANADAIRGLNPKMTIWNTGAQAGSKGGQDAEGNGMGGMDSIRNIYQMLPPLMSTINEQTGGADISYIANMGGLGAMVHPRKQAVEHN